MFLDAVRLSDLQFFGGMFRAGDGKVVVYAAPRPLALQLFEQTAGGKRHLPPPGESQFERLDLLFVRHRFCAEVYLAELLPVPLRSGPGMDAEGAEDALMRGGEALDEALVRGVNLRDHEAAHAILKRAPVDILVGAPEGLVAEVAVGVREELSAHGS